MAGMDLANSREASMKVKIGRFEKPMHAGDSSEADLFVDGECVGTVFRQMRLDIESGRYLAECYSAEVWQGDEILVLADEWVYRMNRQVQSPSQAKAAIKRSVAGLFRAEAAA